MKPLMELKIELLRKEISRRDLANRLEIKYSTLNSYLNGFSRMPDDILSEIKEILVQKGGDVSWCR